MSAHCTHWTEDGEECCSCGRVFETIKAAWSSECHRLMKVLEKALDSEHENP